MLLRMLRGLLCLQLCVSVTAGKKELMKYWVGGKEGAEGGGVAERKTMLGDFFKLC